MLLLQHRPHQLQLHYVGEPLAEGEAVLVFTVLHLFLLNEGDGVHLHFLHDLLLDVFYLVEAQLIRVLHLQVQEHLLDHPVVDHLLVQLVAGEPGPHEDAVDALLVALVEHLQEPYPPLLDVPEHGAHKEQRQVRHERWELDVVAVAAEGLEDLLEDLEGEGVLGVVLGEEHLEALGDLHAHLLDDHLHGLHPQVLLLGHHLEDRQDLIETELDVLVLVKALVELHVQLVPLLQREGKGQEDKLRCPTHLLLLPLLVLQSPKCIHLQFFGVRVERVELFEEGVEETHLLHTLVELRFLGGELGGSQLLLRVFSVLPIHQLP
mmetsp:Transcript_7583/g.6929  ORF Transcript_7583/g.6929 Transcript_7583/m.6929 type:complete len:321 (-) Transcript_7583:866-1828(-)